MERQRCSFSALSSLHYIMLVECATPPPPRARHHRRNRFLSIRRRSRRCSECHAKQVWYILFCLSLALSLVCMCACVCVLRSIHLGSAPNNISITVHNSRRTVFITSNQPLKRKQDAPKKICPFFEKTMYEKATRRLQNERAGRTAHFKKYYIHSCVAKNMYIDTFATHARRETQ